MRLWEETESSTKQRMLRQNSCKCCYPVKSKGEELEHHEAQRDTHAGGTDTKSCRSRSWLRAGSHERTQILSRINCTFSGHQ